MATKRVQVQKGANRGATRDGEGQLRFVDLIIVAVLLVLPLVGLWRLGFDPGIMGAVAVVVSAVTYFVYAHDKRCARENRWRVPESTLHFLELTGGWPGAFLAQRRLRHKCSKGSYQFVFWAIVAGYQLVALDSMLNWRYSRMAAGWWA